MWIKARRSATWPESLVVSHQQDLSQLVDENMSLKSKYLFYQIITKLTTNIHGATCNHYELGKLGTFFRQAARGSPILSSWGYTQPTTQHGANQSINLCHPRHRIQGRSLIDLRAVYYHWCPCEVGILWILHNIAAMETWTSNISWKKW